MANSNFIIRDSCPVCSSKRIRTIYECPFEEPPINDYLEDYYSPQGGIEFEYLEHANYSLSECDDCGLIYQREILNDDFMKRLYDRWIDPQRNFCKHQNQDRLKHYSNFSQEIMQIIAYFDQKPSTLTFFDFGMGWGRWALMAKAFGCDSYGSELSKARINFAKSNGVKVISWEEIPQYKFDFINSEQVFEHLAEPTHTLCYLKQALKPNGIIKISVPTGTGIRRRLKYMDWKSPKESRNSLNPVAPLEHVNFFRRTSLLKMASIAGMQEIFIPISTQYKYLTGWEGMNKIGLNILMPIIRNVLKKQNYMFLRIAQ